LLDRHGRGVAVTEAGKTVLQRVYSVINELENIRADAWGHVRYPSGEISLGTTPSVTQTLAPRLVERFHGAYPDVRLSIHEGGPGLVYDWLLRGRTECAILYDVERNPDIESIPLIQDRLYIVGSPKLPSLGDGSISSRALDGLRLVLPSTWYRLRREFERLKLLENLQPNILAEVDSVHVLKALVRRGFGYTVLPKYAVTEEVLEGRLWVNRINGLAPSVLLKFVRPRHRVPSSAGRELQRILLEEVASLLSQGWGEAVD
jgi:LysR family nitrogen assimilation transcriptional regulator